MEKSVIRVVQKIKYVPLSIFTLLIILILNVANFSTYGLAKDPNFSKCDDANAAKIRKLITELGDKDENIQKNAIKALEKIINLPFDILFPVQRDMHLCVRRRRGQVLNKIENLKDVPSLIAILKHGRGAIKVFAVKALGSMKASKTIPFLIEIVKNKHQEVRVVAVWALGETKNLKAVPALVTALEDKHKDVRAIAAWALGQTKSLKTIPALVTALEDEHKDVRVAAVWALGRTRSLKAMLSLLRAAMLDEHDSVRSAAAVVMVTMIVP